MTAESARNVQAFFWEEVIRPLLEEELEDAIDVREEDDPNYLGVERIKFSVSEYIFGGSVEFLVRGPYEAQLERDDGGSIVGGEFTARIRLSGPVGGSTSLRCTQVDVSPR